MHSKLTLRLDSQLIRRAKVYAKRSGKSVSSIVADYFTALDVGEGSPEDRAQGAVTAGRASRTPG